MSPSRDQLIDLILRETTDKVTADGVQIAAPNILEVGCRYVRGDPRRGYENPAEAARQFAGFIADAVLSFAPVAITAGEWGLPDQLRGMAREFMETMDQAQADVLVRAATALETRPASVAETAGRSKPLAPDEGGCVTKRFVIFTRPDMVPEKKGGWLKNEYLIEFLREVMLHDGWGPGFRATVLELTWDNDLWASSATEYLSIHDHAIGPGRARKAWLEARDKHERIYKTAPSMPLGHEIAAHHLAVARDDDKLQEALNEARHWHDSRRDDLGKQPPSGDRDWRRMEHANEITRIDATLKGESPS